LFQRRAGKRQPWRRRTVWIAAVTIILGAATLFVVHVRDDRRTPHIDPKDAQQVALGRRLYGLYCASCHGADLEGQADWRSRKPDGRLPAPPHDASGHTWHHTDEVLFNITKHGVAKVAGLKDYQSAMPAYEGVLGDEQIVAVLSWIKAQWPPDVRAKHDQINEQGDR